MKTIVRILLIGTLLAPLTVSAQVEEQSKADPRLLRTLNEMGMKYTERSSGTFQIVLAVDSNRTQLVTLTSQTQTLEAIEVREVFSAGWVGSKEPSAHVANTLLRENNAKIIGAWELAQKTDGTFIAGYNVKAAADCDATALRTMIKTVAFIADTMEKKLLGTDGL